MSMITKAAAAIGAILCGSCTTIAGGKPPTILRVPLATAVLDGSPKIARVEVKQITLAAGQRSGRHRHPCPVVSYVVSGKIFFKIEGQPAQYFGAGSAVYEAANVVVEHFDAVDESATFIASYLLGADQHDLIKML